MVVHDKVKEIIANQLAVNIKDITDNTTFSDINADSLDVVDIIMALESEFNLQIPDEEVDNFNTIGDLASFITKILKS
jgi:acyl carrier protein